MKTLRAFIASASLRNRPTSLGIPAPAHRRRALRWGPRNRRLHWRKTAAPSKGGLHESQPAYPGRSICGGWAVAERTSPPLNQRSLSCARRSVAGQGTSGGAACGGNAAASRRDCKFGDGRDFDGVIGRLRCSHPLLEGGRPEGPGDSNRRRRFFWGLSPNELARRERTTLLAGSTPYDIWELPFQGLPSAARPDLRKSPLRVIRGAQPLILILKAGISKGRPAP